MKHLLPLLFLPGVSVFVVTVSILCPSLTSCVLYYSWDVATGQEKILLPPLGEDDFVRREGVIDAFRTPLLLCKVCFSSDSLTRSPLFFLRATPSSLRTYHSGYPRQLQKILSDRGFGGRKKRNYRGEDWNARHGKGWNDLGQGSEKGSKQRRVWSVSIISSSF